MLISPTGRFEINKDLCKSLADNNPEMKHPTWTISNILHGLVSYMLNDENEMGAIKSTSVEIEKLSYNFRCKECAHTNS